MTQGKNFLDLSSLKKESIKFILCDIDDTLTNEGKLFSEAYDSLWRLHRSGFKIIPITGRPAGWCEMIARIWPVDGIVGENGAFYFYYLNQHMHRSYTQNETTRETNKIKLLKIRDEVLQKVSGSAVASDQFCRAVDLAIDFCEDVPALPESKIQDIVKIFKTHGAEAKVSSIHVNGWFGQHDKLTTTLQFLKDRWDITKPEQLQEEILFVGDSPNDEPMFKYFQNSVGVKNIEKYLDGLKNPPRYLCTKEGGLGFQELAKVLLV
jgi:HAD superfamily hydrolase (TIGR01484 family)